MQSQLRTKIGERVERVSAVETALILTVSAFYLTVVTWRVQANQLVPDTQISSRFLKECNEVAFLKIVVGLHGVTAMLGSFAVNATCRGSPLALIYMVYGDRGFMSTL